METKPTFFVACIFWKKKSFYSFHKTFLILFIESNFYWQTKVRLYIISSWRETHFQPNSLSYFFFLVYCCDHYALNFFFMQIQHIRKICFLNLSLMQMNTESIPHLNFFMQIQLIRQKICFLNLSLKLMESELILRYVEEKKLDRENWGDYQRSENLSACLEQLRSFHGCKTSRS